MKLLATLAAAALLALQAGAHATGILVPAYFYPSFDPAQSQWDEMTAAAASGVPVTAIMNVANGPGTAVNSDYVAAVNAFKAAGGTVVGYVYTCDGRDLCASGFYTTRMGVKDLGYAGNVPLAQWTGCPAAANRHLGT